MDFKCIFIRFKITSTMKTFKLQRGNSVIRISSIFTIIKGYSVLYATTDFRGQLECYHKYYKTRKFVDKEYTLETINDLPWYLF